MVRLSGQGVTFLFVRPDLFMPNADYQRETDEMERRTRAIPPATGFSEVLIPGDPEWRTRITRRANGIPVENAVWERIQALPD